MRKCKNCGCVITRYKKDEYCPKCTELLAQDQPYKLFKRRTHRMLFVGLRDAVIIAVLALLLSQTRFGLYLKWYVYASAGLMLVGSLVGYAVMTAKVNNRMIREGYGDVVEQDDFFVRCAARLRNRKSS